MRVELAKAIGAQARHALAVEGDGLARLGARFNVDVQLLAVQLLHGAGGTQGRVHHGHAHRHVQVVGVALKYRVRLGVHLYVEVTRGAAAVADLALGGHADAHAVADTGRNGHGDIAALAHAAVATAVPTRIGDNLTEALALRAIAGGHHVAQQAALDLLDLAHAITVITGHRLGLGLGTGALAAVTQHGGIHLDLLLDAAVGLLEANGGAQECILARLHAGARAAGSSAAAEELSEEIAQTAAAKAAVAAAGRAALLHRIAAHVHDLAFLRIQENLLGQGGLAELLRGLVIARVHVRVVLARQLAVGLLNLGIRGRLFYTKNAVVVTSHVLSSFSNSRCCFTK